MQPDDAENTVVRARQRTVDASSVGTGEPEDLEADTFIRLAAPVGPTVPVDEHTPAEPFALVEPPAPVEAEPQPVPVVSAEPHALVEPPPGHPAVVERPVTPRVGLPVDPGGFTVPWYRIRVNRHEPIPLDAPALIGRRPVSPRIAIGGVPRLVRVPSPGREVSSTHVELRQQGASVIVTDLRSTNGTVVSIPGSSSQKLRQGESLVVSAGTVVDIGDGNTVEILPIERLV
ncbi:hypothetical protein BH10ACT4_BH10ACT4_02170 [soil metagenome]